MLSEISVYAIMLLSGGLAITTKYAVNNLFCVQTEYYDWKVFHYSCLYNDLSLRLSLSSLTKIVYILPHTSIGDCYDVFAMLTFRFPQHPSHLELHDVLLPLLPDSEML